MKEPKRQNLNMHEEIKMTGQDIYQIYHRECLKAKTGVIPRKIKNFDNYENKETKHYFERVAQMKAMAGDIFNVDLYIEALAKQYEGFFNPKALIAPSAMKVYRLYLLELNNKKDPIDIYERILADIRFVVKFCKEQEFKYFEDYLEHDQYLIPSVIKHAYNGQTSYFFLACVDSFPMLMKNYPSDSQELLKDFNYKVCRSKIIFDAKCRTIADNLSKIITSSLSK